MYNSDGNMLHPKLKGVTAVLLVELRVMRMQFETMMVASAVVSARKIINCSTMVQCIFFESQVR